MADEPQDSYTYAKAGVDIAAGNALVKAIAPLARARSPELAQRFVDYVLGPEGQQVLVKHGFIPAIDSPTGAFRNLGPTPPL